MKELNLALTGNPNCGKSSLFNILTGMNQKVSNFPGTTVDRKTGFFDSGETRWRITDLPGAYSLYPKSEDEVVTFQNLCNDARHGKTDVIIFIADASNLKRNLLLYTQIADLGLPMVFILNMTDLAERKGIEYDYKLLESRLGVEVVPMNIRKKKGLAHLKEAISRARRSTTAPFFDPDFMDSSLLDESREFLGIGNSYQAVLWMHNHMLLFNDSGRLHTFRELLHKYAFSEKKMQVDETISRYRLIDEILTETSNRKTSYGLQSLSSKIDRVITHRYLGIVFFLFILFIIFQSVFSLASLPMDWIEASMSYFSNQIEQIIPGGKLNDLVVHGILAGLSGVIVFIPQIAILFFFISLLEDVGYMSRVSFIMDRLMRTFGLNGKSIVPLISGMACAVPAIMSARSIENKKEKLITIMVIPLMSCSARLPVYTLLISMLCPERYIGGFINLQGLVLMGMYVLGFVMSLLSALVFSKILKTTSRNYFVMEMPAYKFPIWRNVMMTIYEKCRSFIFQAGRIIIAISILLWMLASFGPKNEFQQIDSRYRTALATHGPGPALEAAYNAEKLEASYAGHFGKTIEPLVKPLGFNWKIGIALITSFAAREVFVGTITTLYSNGSSTNDFSSIRARMLEEKDPATGKPVYTFAVLASLLVFYAFAMQCMSTLAITYRETRSFKWTLYQLLYLTGGAYLASLIVYNLLR